MTNQRGLVHKLMTYCNKFPQPRQISRLLLSLLCLLLGSAACSSSTTQTTVVTRVVMIEGEEAVVTRLVRQTVAVPVTVTPANPEAETVVLDLSYTGAPAELDPITVVDDSDISLVENLFVGLTRFNHTTNSVDPEWATDWEVSPDGKTYTFNLRSDIFWVRSPLQEQDIPLGERKAEAYRPVVANDMVVAVQRLCRDSLSPDVFIFFIIAGCEQVHLSQEPTEADLAAIGTEAVDAHTLRITLTKPASYFLTMTSMWMFRPVPGEIIDALAEENLPWGALENLVTSGPFVPGRETLADTRTVLERNPFWPIPFTGNVDVVNVYWLDREDAYEMWLAKNLDVSPLPPDRQAELERNPNLAARLQLVTRQRVFYLSFNFASDVFGEAAVRRAFSAAIDRETLIEEVYAGRALPMRHFTPPGVVGAPPIDAVGSGYNPDLARIEMANSSFRDCRFMPEVRYLVGTSDLDLFQAETLRDMWVKTLSCQPEQIVIEQVQFGTLLANTRREAGDVRPDIWNLGWASYFPDAHNWLSDVLHCSDSENRQDRPCSEADSILRDAATNQDLATRWDLYRQAERLFFGEGGSAPISPLLVQGSYVLVQTWLTYTPANFGGEQFDTYQLDAVTKRLEKLQ